MTVQGYLAWFDEVTAPTTRVMKLVPPEKISWRLTERSFSIGQLMDHIGRSLWFNGKVVAREEPPLKSMREILVSNRREPEVSVDVAVRQFEQWSRGYREIVGRLSENDFQNLELDTPQKGKMVVWRFCAFALEHHIHHLMELHICLKVLGVKVHTGTLYTVESNG